VVGAFNREYRISVVEDGVATLCRTSSGRRWTIVSRAFGRVVQSKEVLGDHLDLVEETTCASR